MGLFARRQQRGLLARWIFVWIVAYALALQPLLAGPIQVRGPDGNPLFALCLGSKAAPTPASTDNPAGNNDHDIHCKLCVHGGLTFAGTPDIGTAWSRPHTTTGHRWAVIDNPVPDSAGFIGEYARGPPLLA